MKASMYTSYRRRAAAIQRGRHEETVHSQGIYTKGRAHNRDAVDRRRRRRAQNRNVEMSLRGDERELKVPSQQGRRKPEVLPFEGKRNREVDTPPHWQGSPNEGQTRHGGEALRKHEHEYAAQPRRDSNVGALNARDRGRRSPGR